MLCSCHLPPEPCTLLQSLPECVFDRCGKMHEQRMRNTILHKFSKSIYALLTRIPLTQKQSGRDVNWMRVCFLSLCIVFVDFFSRKYSSTFFTIQNNFPYFIRFSRYNLQLKWDKMNRINFEKYNKSQILCVAFSDSIFMCSASHTCSFVKVISSGG